MATTNLNIRTDAEVKRTAEQIFEALGMNMTTAINIFLRQSIRENGIPFSVRLDVPNAVTQAAMAEGHALAQQRQAVGYTDMDDLRVALDQ